MCMYCNYKKYRYICIYLVVKDLLCVCMYVGVPVS